MKMKICKRHLNTEKGGLDFNCKCVLILNDLETSIILRSILFLINFAKLFGIPVRQNSLSRYGIEI